MRSKPLLAAVAALVVLTLIVRQVTLAVHHTFTPRADLAILDRATPAEQNGLTLLEIQNVSPDRQYSYTDKGPRDDGGTSLFTADHTGLWIRLPEGHFLPSDCSSSDNPGCEKALSISARTSTGQSFPLHWVVTDFQGKAGTILTSIPPGYPNTIQWMDVSFDDRIGNKATWRITHLPPMQHVLPPLVKPQTMFHLGGILFSATAYRGIGYNSPRPTLMYELQGTISGAAHQWELGHMTITQEWEPPNAQPREINVTYGSEKSGNQVKFETSPQEASPSQIFPYLNVARQVRLSGQLQEFETYDETVVFHKVSVVKVSVVPGMGVKYLAAAQPQTVTSPSGISVTLVDVQNQTQHNNHWGGDGVGMLIRYPQTSKYPTLPHSPFWRKYKRPITVTVDFPKPYQDYGSSSSDTEGEYRFHSNGPMPQTFQNFPIILRQRVELRMVPMTFTLPILDKKPAKFP